jgi:hypothetical protein
MRYIKPICYTTGILSQYSYSLPADADSESVSVFNKRNYAMPCEICFLGFFSSYFVSVFLPLFARLFFSAKKPIIMINCLVFFAFHCFTFKQFCDLLRSVLLCVFAEGKRATVPYTAKCKTIQGNAAKLVNSFGHYFAICHSFISHLLTAHVIVVVTYNF